MLEILFTSIITKVVNLLEWISVYAENFKL